MAMAGERFDSDRDGTPEDGRRGSPRPFLGVHFACCSVYARVYIHRSATHYVGHCPRCGRRIDFRIGPGGTDERFFTAY
jgi:hypothetical protein